MGDSVGYVLVEPASPEQVQAARAVIAERCPVDVVESRLMLGTLTGPGRTLVAALLEAPQLVDRETLEALSRGGRAWSCYAWSSGCAAGGAGAVHGEEVWRVEGDDLDTDPLDDDGGDFMEGLYQALDEALGEEFDLDLEELTAAIEAAAEAEPVAVSEG